MDFEQIDYLFCRFERQPASAHRPWREIKADACVLTGINVPAILLVSGDTDKGIRTLQRAMSET